MPRQQAPLSTEYILLGFLNRRSIHGYDLYKTLCESPEISTIWTVKQSYLYALLEKLEELGLLVSVQVSGEPRPNRKEYSLTSVGRQTFDAWMRSPVDHSRDMRQEFLAKLFFAYQDDPMTARELLEEQRSLCVEWLESAQISLANLNTGHSFEVSVLRFRLFQNEAMIAWLDDCLQELP